MSYSLASKWLHRWALNSPARIQASFEMERLANECRFNRESHFHHVFVSGLARSGSTILMRAIYGSEKFCSLTYKDMPFVLAPNLWAKIGNFSKRQIEKQMRIHGDGLIIDCDSPEALEEVFWRAFAGKNYIFQDRLVPHVPDSELVQLFRVYVALIRLRYNTDRYLSKNNNNILRLKTLHSAFPNASILIPFRQPIQHSFSLLTQHQNLIKLQSRNAFIEKYMSWLAHHEFGIDQRPFVVDPSSIPNGNKDSLDYWLEQWIFIHSYLLKTNFERKNGRLLFVCYEDLCGNSKSIWKHLCEHIEISFDGEYLFEMRKADITAEFSPSLAETANEIYEKLRAISIT
ncbi:MAG: sulfotransferase [Bdellovibrionales bacterium]|nr:sulfotransferase [Bdellovibrionales bacterium]